MVQPYSTSTRGFAPAFIESVVTESHVVPQSCICFIVASTYYQPSVQLAASLKPIGVILPSLPVYFTFTRPSKF